MTTPAPAPRTAALLGRTETLQSALASAGDRLPPEVVTATGVALRAARERLELGVDHTVVALVGGTGSGKSTLFNALTGLEFADAGVRRPTTSRVTACVWAHDATALLDWLDVDPARRIERESALDGESQADLRGLVLLDLPDHDSVEPLHRSVVDRLIPMVDLLVWVVDPQKYADDALHSGYLRHLVGHEGAMLVLLNQLDAVPPGRRDELLADVGRLLREDGLVDVATLGISARTGDGLGEVRDVLAELAKGRSGAEVRVEAELADAARALSDGVGPGEPDLPVARAVDDLVEAVGLAGAVAAVSAGSVPERKALGPVQADRVALVRAAWVKEIGAALPDRWAAAVRGAVVDPRDLTTDLDRAVGGVPVPTPTKPGAARWLAPLLLGLLACGAAAVAVLAVLGVLDDVGDLGSMTDTLMWAGAGTAALLVLAAVITPLVIARRRRSAARERGRLLDAAGRAAVAEVVAAVLSAPTQAVLDEHRVVRQVAADVRTPHGTVAWDDTSPTRRHRAG